jgi:hypothetical protein
MSQPAERWPSSSRLTIPAFWRDSVLASRLSQVTGQNLFLHIKDKRNIFEIRSSIDYRMSSMNSLIISPLNKQLAQKSIHLHLIHIYLNFTNFLLLINAVLMRYFFWWITRRPQIAYIRTNLVSGIACPRSNSFTRSATVSVWNASWNIHFCYWFNHR